MSLNKLSNVYADDNSITLYFINCIIIHKQCNGFSGDDPCSGVYCNKMVVISAAFMVYHGNRCPTVANNERMKDANAAITLLEK